MDIKTREVAILMATYNGEKYISEQIDSILHQTNDAWKLYIHDDNSSDSTKKIIELYVKKHPEKVVFLNDDIVLSSASKNFAYLLEKVDDAAYFMFCDQDDVWLPHKLDVTLQYIKEVEKRAFESMPAMVFSDLSVVDEDLNVLARSMWKYQKLDPRIAKELYKILAQNVVTGCTIMINKAAKKVCLPIPSEYVMHDYWSAINVCKYGLVSYIDKPLTLYRQHQSNELGAHKVDTIYFFSKIFGFIKNIKSFKEKYQYLSFDVSITKIIFWKFYLNLKRLFK